MGEDFRTSTPPTKVNIRLGVPIGVDVCSNDCIPCRNVLAVSATKTPCKATFISVSQSCVTKQQAVAETDVWRHAQVRSGLLASNGSAGDVTATDLESKPASVNVHDRTSGRTRRNLRSSVF